MTAEDFFRNLIVAQPLADGVPRTQLRLLTLGALNWSQNWCRGDRDRPAIIAWRFLLLLRTGLEQGPVGWGPQDLVAAARAMLGRRPRVLITKIGLDGHDWGSRLVAGILRDAGMEVIYTGPWQSPESMASQALEEDVDAIGISSLATDHLLVLNLMQTLADAGLDGVTVQASFGASLPTMMRQF